MIELIDVGTALSRCFEPAAAPDPDPVLDTLFAGDPADRVLETFANTTDPDKGLLVAVRLVDLLRESDAFTPGSPTHPGPEAIEELRRAFRRVKHTLTPDHRVRPTVLEDLSGPDLLDAVSDALRTPPTAGESVAQAMARHVLEERVGGADTHGDTRYTLAQAFIQLGMTPAHPDTGKTLDSDPVRALHQALHELAVAAHNVRGDDESELATRVKALVALTLLDRLTA